MSRGFAGRVFHVDLILNDLIRTIRRHQLEYRARRELGSEYDVDQRLPGVYRLVWPTEHGSALSRYSPIDVAILARLQDSCAAGGSSSAIAVATWEAGTTAENSILLLNVGPADEVVIKRREGGSATECERLEEPGEVYDLRCDLVLPAGMAHLLFGLAVGLDFLEGLDRKHPWNLYAGLMNSSDVEVLSRRLDRPTHYTVRHFSKSLEEFLEMFANTLLWSVFLTRLFEIGADLRIRVREPSESSDS